MKIHKIGTAKLVDDILADLLERADTTEELVVLRAYRDTASGEKRLEWWTTAINSRVWTIGALTYLAHKMHDNPDDDEVSPEE